MTIELLRQEYEVNYEEFIKRFDKTLFYHSLLFRDFLKEFLHFEDYYLIAKENQEIVGALPSFLSSTPLGTSLNSMPFFGSNGGVISLDPGNTQVKEQLLDAFYKIAEEHNCLSSTIINNPFEENSEAYKSFQPDYYDRRIGQITKLPNYTESLEDQLLYSFSAFTRRMIRKAIKNSVLVKKEDTKEAFNFIKKSHIINMQNIGGKRKPDQFFDYIRENFRSDKDYTLWLAYYNQKPIASLLLFYYNNTVEYYVPTILQDFRSIQPLSLIIFTAMMDASKKGYKYWNWGGTWPEQEGVYHFKRKWNADNIPYQHFIKIHNPKVHELSKEMIRKYFPYFYVIPYDKLNA